jgi:hypothetical protein
MHLSFLAILIFGSIYNSFCQIPYAEVTFSGHFGGSDLEEFFGGTGSADGYYYMAGLSHSSDHDLVNTTIDSANIFIVKVDDSGNKVWARTYGGDDYDKARHIMEDDKGNLLFVGGTNSTNGDITYNRGGSDVLVGKIDKAGNIIWFKTYGGTNYEGGRYIMQTSDGGYLVVGYSASDDLDVPNGGRGFHDGWLFKLDKAGNLVWTNTYGGTSIDRPRSVVELDDGSFIFAGQTDSDTMDCTGNHGSTDVWAARIDNGGNLLWSKLYGGIGIDRAYNVMRTSDGNFVISGHTLSGDLTGKGGLMDYYDGLLIKIDEHGNLLNMTTFGGSYHEYFFRTKQLKDGHFIVAGSSSSDDNPVSGLSCKAGDSFMILQYDEDLNLDWGYCTGGSRSDICNELIIDPDGHIVLMGDSKSDNGAVPGNYGHYDYWIIGLKELIDSQEEPVGSYFIATYDVEKNELRIISESEQEVKISIHHIDGSMIRTNDNFLLLPGVNEYSISESAFRASGMYIAKLSNMDHSATVKFPYIRK